MGGVTPNQFVWLAFLCSESYRVWHSGAETCSSLIRVMNCILITVFVSWCIICNTPRRSPSLHLFTNSNIRNDGHIFIKFRHKYFIKYMFRCVSCGYKRDKI